MLFRRRVIYSLPQIGWNSLQYTSQQCHVVPVMLFMFIFFSRRICNDGLTYHHKSHLTKKMTVREYWC